MVALAVISILLALLIPAVQHARAAARRTHCQNNLRQQGVAIENYVSAWGHYPGGGWGATWLGMSDRGTGKRQPGGWIYNILPLCEETAVHALAPAFDGAAIDAQQVQHFATRSVALFACPERQTPRPGPANSDLLYFGQVSLRQCARSDYVINGGTVFFRSIDGPAGTAPAVVEEFVWPDTTMLNGISFLRSEIRPGDVTDGTSHTIAVGEKWTSGNGNAANGDDQPMFSGDCLDIRRWATASPARDGHQLGNETTFGSAHESGATFLFCDGSVRILPYYIDPAVFQSQCSRNDGAVLTGEY